ncbi:mitochondrial ATP-dependent zinc metallopeptidase [Trypanosoma rangeli]|uniref:Mitochondrial ATP-dependent zinc metallopeptidase n=1 Tax=Trypanosoma rangeli TaxID=5698 RepID=A0A422P1U6_TRYRA|nr:mitochondrial ATP-dependent zinc metallopeptidase [Trypanosoma rangeli]RNF11688.1 mitochondrial ATP-dependent zinc metallopeptidase [Trypanosoma rangeli]|eukprot:RNF11688.1 mitochondrial ATP-dependent zinc metallopeptidase [Trypanosoma rangeli]
MPVRRNSGSAGTKKSVEDCASQSQAEQVNFPHANGLLQKLLIDLGFTETAKTLEEESCRRLQSSACPTTEHLKSSGNGAQPLNLDRSENKASNSNLKEARTMWHNGKEGSGNSACAADNVESESEKQPPPLYTDVSRMALFRILMHQNSEEGDEVTNVGALQELCRFGIAPLRWDTSQHAPLMEGNCNKDTNHNGLGELIALTPYLRKLFNLFLTLDNSSTEHREEASRTKSVDILPLEWASLLEVFFAYVEVLWAQVYLVEVVSWADFTSQGWLHHRDSILERLSMLHEKLQRLLLDAHQVEVNSHMFEHSAPCQGKNQQAGGLPSPEDIKTGLSLSYASAREGAVSLKEMRSGIIELFCRGAPILRKNIEDVSTWIISHCEHQNKGHHSYDFLDGGVNEAIAVTESVDASPSEAKAEVEGDGLARKSWQRLMDVVRHAVLREGEEVPESPCHTAENLSVPNPRLCWAQMFLRIQLLAWVVGSLAEFSDVFLQHLQMSTESTTCEAKRTPRRGSHEVCQRSPTVSASLGFWYQNCAAQISKLNDANQGNCKGSMPIADKGKEENSFSRLPCSRSTKEAKENDNIGSTFVNTFKRAAHEFLVGAPTSSAPLRLSLVGNGLQHETGETLSNRKEIHGGTHSCTIGNYDSDINMVILGALATGQPYHVSRASTPRRVPLYFLLKRILRAPKVLLDLQNERVHMDIQLGSMENPAVHRLLVNFQGNGRAKKGLRNGSCGEQTQSQEARNEPAAVRTYEGDISVSGEATSATADPPRTLSDGTGIGVDMSGAMEEPAASTVPPIPSFQVQLQSLMDRMIHQTGEVTQSEESTSIESDEDGVSSTDNNLDRPIDVVLNEVQIVAVTPCGSLLALLTTKGRLVVFALRTAKSLPHTYINEQLQESFCEQRVLDVVLAKDSKEPYWYEQLESFLAFSPSGRFLLCSVQNAPPYVPEGSEANRSHHATTGKVFLYSLHCREDSLCESSDVLNPSLCGDEDRLYGAFQIHKTLITVTRWLDPRFWRGTSSSPSRICPLPVDSPLWKGEAHRRLSALQCLSSGRDNLILRWLPADGSIIQRIDTLPVFDILVSPLMQAFYTINQCGQLSMYDAWNERDVENAKDNVVVVSQRGLPAALAALQSPAELRDGNFMQNSAYSSKDGEIQDAFFVGTRRIGFDRRCLAGGRTGRESAVSRMSKLVQESGVPAGTETKRGSKLGRRIVQQVLHQEGDYLGPHTLAVLEPSSGSEMDNDHEDIDDEEGEATGVYRNRRQGGANRDMDDGSNPISFFRPRHSQGERKKTSTLHGESQRYNNAASLAGEAVLYRTGSRLVFEEVSQLLCHTVSLWPDVQKTRYASPPQPYQLLSMAASGNPVWSDADDENSLTCDEFIFREKSWTSSSASSTLSYYTDACKTWAKQGHGNGHITNNTGRRYHRKTGTSSQNIVNGGGSYNTINNHPKPKWNVGLSPVAQNGRYLCIMASVGPSRVNVPYERPLEYRAGIYACMVFDVLYGSVLRVIPVCPVLPRATLTENGVSQFHSHRKRAPIYMLPCAVTVVRHPDRRRSEAPSPSLSVSGRVSCGPAGGTPSLRFRRHVQADQEGEEAKEEEEAMGNNYTSDHDNFNSVNGDDDDSMVLVAVGALHSTTYVFDALTGSRVKVLNLRKQVNSNNNSTSLRTRPPTKRTRCSYFSLGDLGGLSGRPSHGDNGASDDDDDDDNQRNQTDDASSTTSSELPSPRNDDQYSLQRQLLLSQLAERHGMDTLLKAVTKLLRVVPIPFPPFCATLQEDGTRRLREDVESNGCRRRQSCLCGGSSTIATSFSSSFSIPLSAAVSPCFSFLGQLQLAARGVSGGNGFHSGVARSNGEGKASSTIPFYDVPFAHAAQKELRQVLSLNETPPPVEENGVLSTGGAAGAALAMAATIPMRPTTKPQKRFRCGVVNSVALLYDHAKGGVFVFSSDEYGGLFLAGGVIPPRV